MQEQPEGDAVVVELEALKQRLDESLLGLAGQIEHVPMHDVVRGLLHRIAEQHAEIQELKKKLSERL